MTIPTHRAESVAHACQLLGELESPMVYGGGTAIQILLKQDVLFATDFVDIGFIDALKGIEATPTGLRLGALMTLRQVELSADVKSHFPLLSTVYGRVANARVRNTASVGGNISHGDYRLDPPTGLMVMDAVVEIASTAGVRTMPIREFFVDFQMTALEPGEIVQSILLPYHSGRFSQAFVKESSLAMNDWPVASVAAFIDARPDGTTLRLGIGALAAMPCYVETDISGAGLAEAVAAGLAAAKTVIDPLPDIRGSVDYKTHLGAVAVEDAVTKAWEGLQ